MSPNDPSRQRTRDDLDYPKDGIRVLDLFMDYCSFDKDQPSKRVDEGALEELADSIKRHGLLHPITVRRHPTEKAHFIIVAGERRFRAFQRLGRDIIPAVLTSGDPVEISLIENIQRESLSPLGEAEALEHLREKYEFTREELGAAVGKAQGALSATLRLNGLSPDIKAELTSGTPRSLLLELAKLRDEEQLELWEEAKKGLALRGTREQTRAEPEAAAQESVLTLGRRFVSELERVSESDRPITSGEYEELLEIHESLGQLLEAAAGRGSG